MTIEEIKENLSIHQVLEYYQIRPKNGMISCPFHEDKTPSMQVYYKHKRHIALVPTAKHTERVWT